MSSAPDKSWVLPFLKQILSLDEFNFNSQAPLKPPSKNPTGFLDRYSESQKAEENASPFSTEEKHPSILFWLSLRFWLWPFFGTNWFCLGAFFSFHPVLGWTFPPNLSQTTTYSYMSDSFKWWISNSCYLTTIYRRAGLCLSDRDNKELVTLSTKNHCEPMPPEAFTLKVIHFPWKCLIRRKYSKEQIIKWNIPVWNFSDFLRGQMLLRQAYSLEETWEKSAWEKAEQDGCSSINLQGARVNQTSGQQETTHAKGKH